LLIQHSLGVSFEPLLVNPPGGLFNGLSSEVLPIVLADFFVEAFDGSATLFLLFFMLLLELILFLFASHPFLK